MESNTGIHSLVAQLIEVSTGLSSQSQDSAFQESQQHVLKIFKASRAARTNPFDVQQRLAGLEEKFRILNNEELADALHSRLENVPVHASKWMPEIFSLLLQLSDNPLRRTAIEDLELLKLSPPPSPLTWAKILQDDPLDNKDGLWDNIDFGQGSSEDDEDSSIVASVPDGRNTPVSSIIDEDTLPDSFDDFEAVVSLELAHDILGDQNRVRDREGASKYDNQEDVELSETQVVREVLNLLRGLPSPIYSQAASGYLNISSHFRVSYLSKDTLQNTLGSFYRIASALSTIRRQSESIEMIPLIQSFKAALSTRMLEVETFFANIDARILKPSGSLPVTLLTLSNEVHRNTRCILSLTNALPRQSNKNSQMAFQVLESLFSMTCMQQNIGDRVAYEYNAKIFFECVYTYIRPIRVWMDTGELDPRDQIFFIQRNIGDVPLSSLWANQYTLICDEGGQLHAPAFLHVTAKSILNAGKSVIFMQALGSSALPKPHNPEPPLDFDTVCGQEDLYGLNPFSELFAAAFGRWIASKHHLSSRLLREALNSNSGLWMSLDALEHIFLDRDGATSSQIANLLFERIDRGKPPWIDRFVLTQLYREVFGQITSVQPDCLTVHVNQDSKSQQSSIRSLDNLSLISVDYSLPWAVSNIIQHDTLRSYQRISTLLLQVRRAKQLLEQRKFKNEYTKPTDKKHRDILTLSIRHQLSWFVNTILSYLTTVVLQEASAKMRTALAQAEDIDDMIRIHQTFIERLESQCLLSSRLASTYQALIATLDLVILFSDTCALTTQSQSLPRRQSLNLDDEYSSDGSKTDVKDNNIRRKRAQGDGLQLQKLEKVSATYKRLLSFMLSGVKEVHRSSPEPCWEILGDNLAFGTKGFAKRT